MASPEGKLAFFEVEVRTLIFLTLLMMTSRPGVANVSTTNKEGHRATLSRAGFFCSRKTFSKYIDVEFTKMTAELKRGKEKKVMQ